MNNNIKEYAFTDCLLIDFGVDKLLSKLFLIVEAFYKIKKDGTRQKGLLRIEFSILNNIRINKTDELEYDINQPYDKDGNDVKANELYSIEISVNDENCKTVKLSSDMLNFEIEFVEIAIIEI